MPRKDLTPRYAALAGAIEAKLKSGIERLPTSTGELGYRVEPELLLEVCRTLRDDPELKLEMLIDVCGVDYQGYGLDEWQTTGATGTTGDTAGTGDATGTTTTVTGLESATDDEMFDLINKELGIS